MEPDAVYYRRRAREERQAAAHAPLKGVRDRQLEMALAYELRARFLLRAPHPCEVRSEPLELVRHH